MSFCADAGPRGMTEPRTHTVEVAGAVITYDVREAATGERPLMLIGSPMDAAGFVTLAGHFPDRTVVTYDPRGTARSEKTDGALESTPEQHAGDLHAVIAALGAGPVDLFASSGGAVNALALLARHPEDVRTLVAHEPPLAKVLPDREEALAAVRGVADAYQRGGFGPGMARFIALTSVEGLIPADFAEVPVDPSAFGLPTEDDGRRDDPLLAQNIITCIHYEPDFEALRSVPTRIVVAAGAESAGQMAHRGALGVAERLGTAAVTFPSDHGGFLGGEYGGMGDPDGFAAKLREVLA
jgi:pimeloyl-ACP methyl ester carboxylesterase